MLCDDVQKIESHLKWSSNMNSVSITTLNYRKKEEKHMIQLRCIECCSCNLICQDMFLVARVVLHFSWVFSYCWSLCSMCFFLNWPDSLCCIFVNSGLCNLLCKFKDFRCYDLLWLWSFVPPPGTGSVCTAAPTLLTTVTEAEDNIIFPVYLHMNKQVHKKIIKLFKKTFKIVVFCE